MATLTATPGDISIVAARAVPGDTILMTAGTYTAFPQRPDVTYQAFDWAQGRAITGTTGHLGNGFGVRVTTTLNLNQPGIVIRGVFHDTRGLSSINAGVFSASNITMEDCTSAARPSSGGRQIGYTLGTGAIRVSNIRFLRCRHHPTGQPNNALDHAYYLKNCTGCLLQDVIVYEGGRFPFHLYTNADSNTFERCVVWGSGGGITFSGASDSTTGTSTYGTSDNNRMTGCILGQGRLGSLVESWTSDPGRPVTGNTVDQTILWRGGGGSAVPTEVRGVTLSGIVQKDPGFRNPSIGDFTRSGSYDGFGPPHLFGTVEPPPPPPPPPTEDARDVLLRDLKVDLQAIQTLVVRALGRYGNGA
jgi:hypothetical protein